MINVLLFVLHVYMLRECEGTRVMAMLVWGKGICGCGECMGGTRGSGVVSSADDVLEMSVVRGVRGGGGCAKCVCVWLGTGSGFINYVGTGGAWNMCQLLGCSGVHGVGEGWVVVLVQGLEWGGVVVLWLFMWWVWIPCVDGRLRYLYIVLSGYLRILGAPSVQSCCTLSISTLPTVYLYVGDIANPDLLACGCRTWISLDITRFYEVLCQPTNWSAWPVCPKNMLNRDAIAGGRRGRHNLHSGLPDRCDSYTACRLCRLDRQFNIIR